MKHCEITCTAASSNRPFDSTPPEPQSPVVLFHLTQRTPSQLPSDSLLEGEGFDLSFCVFFRTIQQIVRIFLDFEVENEVENPTT